MLSAQLSEYEQKQLNTLVSTGNYSVEVSNNKFHIGEFFNQDIENNDFFYFEERFRKLIIKQLLKRKMDVRNLSKIEFLVTILQNNALRKEIYWIIH